MLPEWPSRLMRQHQGKGFRLLGAATHSSVTLNLDLEKLPR